MTRLGVLMDPIGSINIKKDSTFAMLLAARARHWEILYFEQADLFLRDGRPWARMRGLEVRDDPDDWFDLAPPQTRPLEELDILLMRKDPPVDLEYFATTYILERAEAAGVLVVNRPASLRDVNEKLYTAWFPQCCVSTLVSRDPGRLREFIAEQQDTILKPLYSMGGSSIFRVRQDDPNTSVILESLTDLGRTSVMAQRFIPEISAGDKRILLIDGEPVPYALARIPAAGETRGNLAVGGRGVGVELTERDRWICTQVAPALRAKGLYFVGLDVIGDYLTEVNVTSPTCIRELDREYGLDIAGDLMDCLAAKLNAH
ncbi:glutathione synthetase [Thiohalobacter sp. COW1]|uniref:glutathione synthase n=1 Tax=Thiohalobacter sp. COW1 TaxID=2795687 RepID=UPI0019152BBC|nr:glutathione synthase [Thiohalobacter sp. COW1]BCO32687.1 glutathione synthetase [Thiohalobacter sp. COW1]